ncbi:MAG TPA: dockerin type I domain-containing protein [candidate division Zixibacteria bacterium]
MNKIKIFICFWLFAILLFDFALAERAGKTTSAIKTSEAQSTKDLPATAEPLTGVKSAPATIQAPANFILVADVLDGFGGQKRGNGCDLSYFAGGQSSPIGVGSSTNFKIFAGFVYPITVRCGDANSDEVVDVGDVVYVINYLFKSGPAPDPIQAADTNCDGNVDVGDVVYLINYLFKGGLPPVC